MAKTTPKAKPETESPAAKRRRVAASRARAQESDVNKSSRKRKSLGAAVSNSSTIVETPRSGKKPRKQVQTTKASREKSRKRAKEFAKTLPNGAGEGRSSDESGKDNDGMDTSSDVDTPTPTEPSPKPTAARPRPTAAPSSPSRPGVSSSSSSSSSSSHHHHHHQIQPASPMPETRPTGGWLSAWRANQSALGGDRIRPSPLPSQGATVGNGGRANQAAGASRSLPSFLREAVTAVKTEDRNGPAPAASNGPHFEAEAEDDDNDDAVTSAGRRRRTTFLDRARAVPVQQERLDTRPTLAPTEGPASGGRRGRGSQPDDDDDGDEQGQGRGQSEAKTWALITCTAVLVPVVLVCLVSGVLLAWPHVKVAAGGAKGFFGGFADNPGKCFVLPGERSTDVCKEGTEVTACPSHGVCSIGRILTCNIPFTMAKDGSDCVLTAEAEKEVHVVVEALRTLTVAQLCKGNGFIMPSPEASVRTSFITLTDAAIAQNRGPLSFLAGMQPGNVAGMIELDGKAASEFGGEGGGSERVARLSKRMYDEVMLTPGWRCKARLAAGSWLLAYWPYCVAMYAVILLVVYLDLRRLKTYETRVQVCAMRDECYRTLLAANAPSQVSHIQSSVGGRRGARGEGSLATIHQDVVKLWPLVEKEVEPDTRIRRKFRNVRGQHNVPCWEWVGPAGTKFESIGGLLPGPAPRTCFPRWLYWWRPTP